MCDRNTPVRGCQQGVVQAVLPARPIEEGTTGAGVIGARGHLQVRGSSAVVSAGADLRAPRSAKVTRRTLSEWQAYWNRSCASCTGSRCAGRPGFNVTTPPWRCRTRSRAPEIRTGHLWVYRGELGEVVYDFTWSRNRDGPLKMLANYRGYLQVDAAPAYNDVFAQSPGIIRSRLHGARSPLFQPRRCQRQQWPVRRHWR